MERLMSEVQALRESAPGHFTKEQQEEFDAFLAHDRALGEEWLGEEVVGLDQRSEDHLVGTCSTRDEFELLAKDSALLPFEELAKRFEAAQAQREGLRREYERLLASIDELERHEQDPAAWVDSLRAKYPGLPRHRWSF